MQLWQFFVFDIRKIIIQYPNIKHTSSSYKPRKRKKKSYQSQQPHTMPEKKNRNKENGSHAIFLVVTPCTYKAAQTFINARKSDRKSTVQRRTTHGVRWYSSPFNASYIRVCVYIYRGIMTIVVGRHDDDALPTRR